MKTNFDCFSKAENLLSLVVDRPHKREIERYRKSNARWASYRAAAKLWGHGVDISKAIEIVESAMRDAGEL